MDAEETVLLDEDVLKLIEEVLNDAKVFTSEDSFAVTFGKPHDILAFVGGKAANLAQIAVNRRLDMDHRAEVCFVFVDNETGQVLSALLPIADKLYEPAAKRAQQVADKMGDRVTMRRLGVTPDVPTSELN